MAEVAGGDEAGLVQGGAVGGALCDLGGEGCLEGARVGRGRLGLALVLLGVLTQGALGGVEGVRLGGEVLDELGLVEELGVEARLGGEGFAQQVEGRGGGGQGALGVREGGADLGEGAPSGGLVGGVLVEMDSDLVEALSEGDAASDEAGVLLQGSGEELTEFFDLGEELRIDGVVSHGINLR